MSVVPSRYPSPFSPKHAEADQFETRDFYVAGRRLEGTVDLPMIGRLTCEIVHVALVALRATPWLPLGGCRDRVELMLDELDNQPGRHQTDSDIRDHTGPVKLGKSGLR
jgi:hypothetical protein